ncbi:MAG: nucleotide exchange factor GrpE [Clostridiales bacterium]|nr:nucleotide exchange factor GrpE [Clostridiales bacterium]
MKELKEDCLVEEKDINKNASEEETVKADEATESVEAAEENTEAETIETEEQDEKDNGQREAEAKIAELTDRLQRTMAEFENYRKRTEKEKAAMFEIGAKSVVEKILPTIDNFERGLSSVPEDQLQDAFVSGMDKVYRQMMKELEEIGVKAIESVGKSFDPEHHNAVMHVEDESVGENVVIEEFQKGYTYRDAVVRYSMVKVAN